MPAVERLNESAAWFGDSESLTQPLNRLNYFHLLVSKVCFHKFNVWCRYAPGAMTSVSCATKPGIKKGALYMPFSIKMSKIFKFNKKLAYDLGGALQVESS
jgi:hypothetical protein